jgi:transcriptional regulator with PAS, ATPase and Fis domain
LCSDVISVPTLRQRIEETPTELEQMVNLLVQRMTGQENQNMTDRILETLKQDLPKGYSWPGNVRELLETLKQDLPKGYSWPGNVRELEQAVRSIILKRHYYGDAMVTDGNKRYGTYEEVARRTKLDPRTVKKHLR